MGTMRHGSRSNAVRTGHARLMDIPLVCERDPRVSGCLFFSLLETFERARTNFMLVRCDPFIGTS